MLVQPIESSFSNDVTCVSKEQYDVHFALYKGYVNKINEIDAALKNDSSLEKSSNAAFSDYRALKKGETFSLDGVILHELYFSNIGKSGEPLAETLKMFEKYFGGFQDFKTAFSATATSARGWCLLVYEQRSRTFRIILQDSHDSGVIVGAYPILVLDMYEHAYFIDYHSNKSEYIEKFIKNINWQVVEQRIKNFLD